MNLLIVEDDVELRAIVSASLQAEGFVVDEAEDGLSGFEKIKNHEYDVVLLDVNLPSKSGHSVALDARALGKTMPIIVLSVSGDVDTKVDLLNSGADDYLVKPFSCTELAARIRALLRRPAVITSDILSVGSVELDTKGCTVFSNGREIHLTPKEFFLLEYLMRNQGRVLSRQSILEHVWDSNADPFTNTVETHILTLRRKLGIKNKRQLIHTVSGVGYKIC